MKFFFVYHLDFRKKNETLVGKLNERRDKERGFNNLQMLRYARKEFAKTPSDRKNIFISTFNYG